MGYFSLFGFTVGGKYLRFTAAGDLFSVRVTSEAGKYCIMRDRRPAHPLYENQSQLR